MLVDKSVICPVYIGRQDDLQALDRLVVWSQEGRGQIALISGEAGIGKSRLVREAKARARPGTVILEGQCFQTDSALPYAPLLDLFRNFFETHSTEEIAHRMAASASELVKLFPELTIFLPHLTPAPGPDPKQEKRRLFQALAQTITDLAQTHPLMLVIEDLHWSDSTSLEFLLLLVRRISSQPILLLITYRAEDTTPELTHFLAELDRERLGTEFALQRLGAEEVDAMLQTILNLNAPVGKEFLDTIFPLTEGNPFFIEEVLKALIASGAGQIAIAAARAGGKVTGIDIAPNLVEQARRRAQAENLDARFDEGDAEMLPYGDSSFDLVISLIGAMFAPRPDLVAAELKRVSRPGGKIIMGNWTPTGFVGQMFEVHAKYVPPAAIMPPPVKWGEEDTVRERFRDGISHLKLNRRLYPFRYPFPPAEVVEFFRTYYGPSHKTFAALDSEKQAALRQELEALWTEHNTATDGTTLIPAEYLEVIAIRQ